MRGFFNNFSHRILQRIRGGCVAFAALTCSTSAVAGLVIDVNQVGSDVVATVSGSFASLPTRVAVAATNNSSFRFTSGWARVYNYPTANQTLSVYNWDAGGAFPIYGTNESSFVAIPDSSTVNTAMQIDGRFSPAFRLAETYTLGDDISGQVTWNNEDYSTLLFNPGTYVGTLENGETITMNINAVPEPGSGALAGLALAGAVLGVARRRRKQIAAATVEQAV